MPPKTRGTRVAKASKENICAVKNKSKGSKALKNGRKPLSDKTNSASDDDAVLKYDKQKQPEGDVPTTKLKEVLQENVERPRRARRLPPRYKENNTLKNLSNSIDFSPLKQESSVFKTSSSAQRIVSTLKPSATKVSVLAKKINSPVLKVARSVTILKESPVKLLNSNLVNRPKRTYRLPKKFEDHSISPNKYIPVQPIHASTPLATKTKKSSNEKAEENISSIATVDVTPVKAQNKNIPNLKAARNGLSNIISADTNNNAKNNIKSKVSPSKSPLKPLRTINTRKLANTSIRLLDDNKRQLKRDSSKLDVYEFTYDPEEEPPPLKKKKKKTVPKKPKQTVKIKSNYEKNLAKALASLKSAVSSKPNTEAVKQNVAIGKETVNSIISASKKDINKEQSMVNEKNFNSVRIEDIARDIHDNDQYHAIDYSPVHSPCRSISPTDHDIQKSPQTQNNADPLNLQDDLSFFDELPVASSSMNVSVRHPLASPWRAEFGSLPIKWQVNTYVKPNMTPAIESSFINCSDSKKKHVYTNMVLEHNEPMPQVVDSAPNLKQTSIISFIKEVVERSAKKKNRGKSTPIKANSIFEELTNTSFDNYKTPDKQTPLKSITNDNVTPRSDERNGGIKNIETQKQDILGSLDKENYVEEVRIPKDSDKNLDKNNTFFGFDDYEDQENVSPAKKNPRAKSLRSRTRGILQEINGHKGPTRAVIPSPAKPKPVQNTINRLGEQIKQATEPPVFPDVTVDGNTDKTNVPGTCLIENFDDENSQSVHLFEDIEVIHHQKANRKSYGKAKKVTFCQKRSVTDSDDSEENRDLDGKEISSDDDNLDDLSFKLPSEKPKRTIKKKKPKKLLSKKEEKEVDEWAAGFNSMCEDIDGFDLVVEK